MAEQILLNFEATEFEGFELPSEFFAYVTRTLKNENGLPIQQKYQAADMDMSPAQFSQKVNKSNNTQITLDEAFQHMDTYGDTRLLDYLYYTLKIKKSLSDDEIDKQIKRLEALKAKKQA